MAADADPQTPTLEDRTPFVSAVPSWQSAIVLLSSVVVAFIVVWSLQWAKPVLIPVALAILLTFLLNPAVKMLHRRGISQTLSTMIAVTFAGIFLIVFVWLIGKQISGMVSELPRNTQKIKAKVKALKQLGTGPTQEQIGQMIEEISHEIYPTKGDGKDSTLRQGKDLSVDPKTGTVIVRSESSHWLDITTYVGSAVEVIATLAFSLVLLVFFLIEREDLRDRIVLLAGRAKLALTSKAVEDITDRVSRYIVMVMFINGGFGLVLTCGLLLIGVPYALLWGLVAATFRFIPYIGPWIGAIFPITMSLATSDGWGQPLAVLAFVGIVELITNNVVEPLLFGHTTGVSPIALLVSAACWLYLWGPIGLVLSAPFAVCLVVLGKNIPQLGFLYLLLGDRPALNTDYRFYQRLMLGDFLEAAGIAVARLKQPSPESIYDELLIPALNFTKRDFLRGYLSDDEQKSVVMGMQVSLAKISESNQQLDKTAVDPTSSQDELDLLISIDIRPRILCCPATDEMDSMSLEMLRQLIDPTEWNLEIASLETLSAELIEQVTSNPPSLVLIAAVPSGGQAHSRYLCKRLRKAAPELQIVVGRFGLKRNLRHEAEQLKLAGANFVTTKLVETRNLLNARLPIVSRRSTITSGQVSQMAETVAS